MADIAAEMGLGLDITFFTGHMSGPNWAPGWLLGEPAVPTDRQIVSGGRVVDRGYRNFFTDPVALAAERLLLSHRGDGTARPQGCLDVEPGQRAGPVRLAARSYRRAGLGARYGGAD